MGKNHKQSFEPSRLKSDTGGLKGPQATKSKIGNVLE